MSRPTDEALMMYADGLLDVGDRDRITAIAAEDPEVRARIEAFRATGTRLADLFDPYLKAPHPMPDWALGYERQAGSAIVHRRFGKKRGGWPRLPVRLVERNAWSALAASVALMCGIGLGWLLWAVPADDSGANHFVGVQGGRLVAQMALRDALEAAPSGDLTTNAPSGVQMHMRMSFQDADGDYCREYAWTNATASHAGVACRKGGDWVVAFQTVLPPRSAPGRIVPAGGSRVVLDAAVGALITGDALSVEDEAGLIRRKWSK